MEHTEETLVRDSVTLRLPSQLYFKLWPVELPGAPWAASSEIASSSQPLHGMWLWVDFRPPSSSCGGCLKPHGGKVRGYFWRGWTQKAAFTRRISFIGFQATEDRHDFQLFAMLSDLLLSLFSFSKMPFHSHQSRNSKLQIGLAQFLPETCHFSSMVLHIVS